MMLFLDFMKFYRCIINEKDAYAEEILIIDEDCNFDLVRAVSATFMVFT